MSAEPTLEAMLEQLVQANRDEYEAKGNVVSSPERFDQVYREKKLRDEENREGSIRRAWENLTGNAPRRVAHAKPEATSQLDYTGGLAATLIADGDWTTTQIIDMLAEADGIPHELAARIYAESLGEGHVEAERRTHRREAREKQAAGVKPSIPHLERLAITAPTPTPVADLDDDDLWNQEPA